MSDSRIPFREIRLAKAERLLPTRLVCLSGSPPGQGFKSSGLPFLLNFGGQLYKRKSTVNSVTVIFLVSEMPICTSGGELEASSSKECPPGTRETVLDCRSVAAGRYGRDAAEISGI